MKKHLWTAAFVLYAAMLLGGCGGGEPKEAEEIEETEETRENEEAEAEETHTEETEELELESVGIRAASPYIFSEGYAWIQLEDTNQLAVVDTDGEIQFTLEISDAAIDNAEATPFYDGASAVYSPNGGYGYAIYSTTGELLTSSDDGNDSTNLGLLAAGDGIYLIKMDTPTFSENSSVLYCIDKNGNKLTDERTYVAPGRCQYMGDGCFEVGSGLFVGGWSDIMYVADGKLHIPEEQETLTEWMDVYFRYRSAEDVVTLDQIETLGNIFNSTYLCDFYNEEDVANMLMDVCYEQGGDGLYYGRKENGWYDRNWNLVIPVPTFSEGVSVVSIGDFSGGFAPIALIGADEKYYFTMIDKTGNLVYEPVGGVERAGKYYFKDGKIAFSDGISLYVIDRDGTLLDPSEDISAFAGSILLKDNSNKAELMINEGFKYIAGSENIYKKLDGTPFDQAVMDENTVHVQFPATSAGN